MLKKSVILLSCFLLSCGCGKPKKELDFKKINSELQDLSLEQLDYTQLAYELIEDLDEFEILNADEIAVQTGITKDMYQNVMMCKSKEEKEIYIVVEPKENQKETIEQKIKQYWDSKIKENIDEETKKRLEKRLEQEYGTHLIYLAGTETNRKLEKIKETKEKIFSNMIVLEKNDVETNLKISLNDIESYTFAVTDKMDTVTQFLIIRPKKEKSSEIKQKIHNYFEELENNWKEKNEKQYNLLKNRLETELDEYLIYLVSKDNKKALKIIEQNYQ